MIVYRKKEHAWQLSIPINVTVEGFTTRTLERNDSLYCALKSTTAVVYIDTQFHHRMCVVNDYQKIIVYIDFWGQLRVKIE